MTRRWDSPLLKHAGGIAVIAVMHDCLQCPLLWLRPVLSPPHPSYCRTLTGSTCILGQLCGAHPALCRTLVLASCRPCLQLCIVYHRSRLVGKCARLFAAQRNFIFGDKQKGAVLSVKMQRCLQGLQVAAINEQENVTTTFYHRL